MTTNNEITARPHIYVRAGEVFGAEAARMIIDANRK